MFVVQTLLWLKKRSDGRKTGCTAWHGCEKRLWVEFCFCTFLFMVFFLYSFRLSLSAILYKLSFQDCQMSSGFLLLPTQQRGARIWKLGLLGQVTDVLEPWGLRSVLRGHQGPTSFREVCGSIWDSFAKDYTTGSLPSKKICHLHLFRGDFFSPSVPHSLRSAPYTSAA